MADQESLIQELTHQITSLSNLNGEKQSKIYSLKQKIEERESRWQHKLKQAKQETKSTLAVMQQAQQIAMSKEQELYWAQQQFEGL